MSEAVFRLHVLPAGNGDALVLEYGTPGDTRRILIDGGVRSAAAAVGEFLGEDASLELLVVTHIDNDHIAGVVKLLNDARPPVPKQVWFNGFRHLPDTGLEAMGPIEGEKFTNIILDRGYPWNTAFQNGPVAIIAPAPAKPPTPDPITGLRLTVLSPGMEQLRILRKGTNWADIVREAGLDPDVPPPPPAAPPSRLQRMGPPDIDALADQVTDPTTRLPMAVLSPSWSNLLIALAFSPVTPTPTFSLPASTSLSGRTTSSRSTSSSFRTTAAKANVTRRLLSRVRARTYVFSTDGSGNQRHPNDQAVARVIKFGGPSPCWPSTIGQCAMRAGIATRSKMRMDIRRCIPHGEHGHQHRHGLDGEVIDSVQEHPDLP